MNKTFILLVALTSATALFGSDNQALADPVEGKWRTEAGSIAEIAPCSAGYCVTMKSGRFSGRVLGTMNGANGVYQGSFTHALTNKTYKGKAIMKGKTLKLSACVLNGLVCQGQDWKRL